MKQNRRMERNILKLGGVEFTIEEVESAYNSNKRFIVHYKTVYEIRYSQAQQQYYATKINILPTNYTKRGRFVLTDDKGYANILNYYKL